MSVRITSFGFGHDAPPRADVILDVRDSLRNPHRDPTMRYLTGLDPQVADHVRDTPGARYIISGAAVLVSLQYQALGDVTVAVGCSGGRHRSVVLAEDIAASLRRRHIPVEVVHRDIDKPVLASARAGGGA
jgi:UPF0042 nucleotide-binding protein